MIDITVDDWLKASEKCIKEDSEVLDGILKELKDPDSDFYNPNRLESDKRVSEGD